MSLETGRVVDPVDLGDFGQALEPPVFADLAAALVVDLAPVHEQLHGAGAALLAETLLDLDAGDAGDFPAGASSPAPLDDDALPLDDLLAAQSGFEDVRSELAAYASTFPPDMVPGTTIHDRRNPPPGNRTPGGPANPGPV